jgi:hypothetical protein
VITKQKQLFFFVNDQPYKTLEDAQKADILRLTTEGVSVGEQWGDECKKDLVEWIMANAAALVDTLTTSPTSRAKARKANGGTKKPAAKRPKLQPAELPKS